jgi:DNA polymerase III delta subunit
MAGPRGGGGRPLGWRDLGGQLARDPLPRVWVLLGDEHELKDDATAELTAVLEKRLGVAPERHRLDCEERPLADLAAGALVGSLFAQSKLVIFNRFEKAPIAQRKALYAELASGELHPCLTVVIHSNERALPAGVDGSGFATFMFWPLNQSAEVQGWVKAFLKKLSCPHSSDLPEHVYERYGSQLSIIKSELSKAKLFLSKEERELTPALFDRVASQPPGEDVFRVLDDVVAGRVRSALTGLQGLWAQGEPAAGVLPILLKRYQQLLHAVVLHEAEPDRFRDTLLLLRQHRHTQNFFQQKSIEKDMGAAFSRAVAGTAFEDELGALKPIQVTGIVQQLPGAQPELVRRVFRDLLQLDFKMKTSAVDPELGLEIAAARPVARGPGSVTR